MNANLNGMQIYIDGRYYEKGEAKVSVFDHGLLYGDGVFEGIRAYNGRVFRLPEHLDRLYDSARTIDLKVPITKEEMSEAILETLRKNNLKDGYIRPIVTRGVGDLGLDPRKCPVASVIIIAVEWGAMYGDLYEKGLKAISVSVRRNPHAALPPNVKSLNYLNNILAKIEANYKGGDEAIMFDMEGHLSEGSGDNIYVVKNGEIHHPAHAQQPPRGHEDGRARAREVDGLHAEGAEHGILRPLLCRRGLCHRHRCRGRPDRDDRRPDDRIRQAGTGHEATDGRVHLRDRAGRRPDLQVSG